MEITITSEKAFDMLPYVVDIYDKLEISGYVKKNSVTGSSNDKAKLQSELGEKMIKYILKNSGKIKEEIFEIVAICADITPVEAKKQDLFETIKVLKQIFSDKDLAVFFRQAMQ